MIYSTKHLIGTNLEASDGKIGHIKDFYFDDENWVVRYLVANTGNWLVGKLVLLSPHSFNPLESDGETLRVNLTRNQIENSPSIDEHKPVSRQNESDYYSYYGWPAYWDGAGMWGLGAYPIQLPPMPSQEEVAKIEQYHHRVEEHLRSVNEVTGYHIEAVDGTIGQVSGFQVDDQSWQIRNILIETGHWYAGKEIRMAPLKIERISYEESKVFVNVTRNDIERTGENELVLAVTEVKQREAI